MSIQRDQEQTESFTLGNNVYGGRPTFALIRDENGNDVEVTLYELLPTDQADARRRRFERRRQQTSKTVPSHEVIGDTDYRESWCWDDWVAVKVRKLSGARLRSVFQLLEETFRDTDIDASEITGTGEVTVLIREEAGIRLSLGFVGVKPLRRIDRMRALARGVAQMSLEECYYWHAKCRSPNSPNGAKALRTLLTEHK